ncbi:MAG: SH3 domain-containing protein [Lachnospiraceae bacterium]
MRKQEIKRVVAGVLIGSMLFALNAYASEEENIERQTGQKTDIVSEADELKPDNCDELAEMDERTEQVYEEYRDWLDQINTYSVGTYSSELEKFPTSYQTYLKKLHEKHPNWVFVALNKSLKWNDIVKEESVSGSASGTNQSLLPDSSYTLLLSKASTDYSVSKGKYIAKDGSTWVSASRPAVAYYADPRNFLTDNYIFMFEALNYNSSYHKIAGVQNILKGTDLYDKKISYINTSGKTVNIDMTYDEAIFAAGGKNKVSPLFLAAKIRQETGASLKNKSISGKTSPYIGYYNYYNIGAYSSNQGSAVLNGLYYAKGGSNNSKTYGRPWTSPVLSINGGAEFLAKSYISRGQNTVYFQRFNTVVSPYYQHQYMQNLTAAASEAKTTYNSYKSMGILDDSYVFYIPVYENMPSQSSSISIQKSVKTGKTTADVTLRKGASSSSSSLGTVPKGKKVTVSGAVYTNMSVSVSNQEKNPYWYKVSYDSKTGYISAGYIDMNTDSKVKTGGTKQLKVTCSGSNEKIYYETSNPAVAKVSASGKVTGVKKGSCDIFAVTSSGKMMDSIGITVTGSSTALAKPKLISVSNSKSGVVVKWQKVSQAKGYYIYRKTPAGSWKSIKKISSGSTVKYLDKTMKAGKKYVYTVRAYSGSQKSSYNKTGLTIRRLRNPELISASSKSTGIKVKWGKVKSAVSYVIYRKEPEGKYSEIAEVKDGSTLSYIDETAEKDITYYYTVRARSGVYKSSYDKAGIRGIRK